ncbi:hypothetical protein ES702_07134 [subsurface metagenome]
MASFIEELWASIFTPGTTPTLLIATNASFAALQLLLLLLLVATYSIHFLILSVICMGLWAAINWFARELQIEKDKADAQLRAAREKSPDVANGSDTETELEPLPESLSQSQPPPRDPALVPEAVSSQIQPDLLSSAEAMRRRRSLGDSSGYVSTDSEWEKISGS